MLGEYLVGSVYLSQDNLRNVRQAVSLMRHLQTISQVTPHQVPILAGCDQEGAWSVMDPEMTRGPGNLALGATSPSQVEAMYKVFGRELRALGIAADLAPCSDVNSNPHNPIIGTRSFGQDAARVSDAVAAAIRGLRSGGSRSCAKHFPGHGNTAEDSHRGLARVNGSREELDRTDLLPFRAAVQAGVDIVMTAHLFYPALDPEWPATLSPAILQGLLRKEMGFRGVILTDSFSMGAIKKTYGSADAAIRALNAGADLIMLAEERYGTEPTSYLQDQVELIEAVRKAVRDGKVSMMRIDEAVSRVLLLKSRAGLFHAAAPTESGALAVVGDPANRRVALNCARGAVVMPRNLDDQLPLKDLTQQLILITPIDPSVYSALTRMRGIGPNISEAPVQTLFTEIKKRCPTVRLLTMPKAADVAQHLDVLRAASHVLVATENYPLPGFDFPTQPQHEVIEAIMGLGIQPIVVGLRDPYELVELPKVRTYVSALGYAPICATAVAEVIVGERVAPGRLPRSL
jgi:beta-N-acetylhexosaminidase